VNFIITIKGFDKAPSAVNKAKENIKNANLEDYIVIKQNNFFETEKNFWTVAYGFQSTLWGTFGY
jgi:23S rRNA G2445 N2-methylase RlmL